ncbi:MAG: NAD-dependent epimerase/dehydratase family protein [Elusimicrobiota bacterium]
MNNINKQIQIKRYTLNKYKNKTILISGGFGYIGSSLSAALFDVKCKIKLLDKNIQDEWIPKKTRAEVTIVKGDVSKKETWQKVLPGIDYLFHLAALEYNRSAFDIYKDMDINALSVIHLLEVCREKQYKLKIVFSSSANLFGLDSILPVNENHCSDPMSLWSVHKLMAENYLKIYAKKYGIDVVILRLANVYGPTANSLAVKNTVINKMIDSALSGMGLTLYANKNCERDYVFIDDVIRAFLFAGISKTNYGFNIIGSGEGKTITKVWELIAREIEGNTGKPVKIKFDRTVKLEPFDMRNFVADTSLFRKSTGWRPTILLKEGIKLTTNALIALRRNNG